MNFCCRCVKVEVDLDAVGDAKIDIGGREFDLVTEAEGIDKEHGAITPVDVYQVGNIFPLSPDSFHFQCQHDFSVPRRQEHRLRSGDR